MGETIEDMDKENKPKDNTNNFLFDKIGISHEETKTEMEKVNVTIILDKTYRIIKILDETPKTHKQTNY